MNALTNFIEDNWADFKSYCEDAGEDPEVVFEKLERLIEQ